MRHIELMYKLQNHLPVSGSIFIAYATATKIYVPENI